MQRIISVWVLVFLAVGSGDVSFLAQSGQNSTLAIAANGESRSAVLDLSTTSQARIVLTRSPLTTDGSVRAYVFTESGVLSGIDDPEIASDTFVFQPSSEGRYFVKIVNTNSSPVSVSLEVSQTRALPPPLGNFATVRVMFATNRLPTSTNGVQFGQDPVDQLTYGFTDVSIPRDHRLGELEAPSIWRLQFREDPAQHVAVIETRRESTTEFYNQLAARVSQSRNRQALVFIHGFNQTFEDAVKRTAQIAYDVAFDGPSVAFSWPSQGTVLDYFKDQRNADLSAAALEECLRRLKGSSKQITIHLIAHSMGNRVLARALERMGNGDQNAGAKALREVAMMAPDVDAALFRQLASRLSASAERVTLYASSQDSALRAAQQVAGYPRAGEGGRNIVVVSGIDTVDASSVETSALGLGHSYYADNSSVLSDIFSLLRGRRPEDRFGLQPILTSEGRYWRFQPAAR